MVDIKEKQSPRREMINTILSVINNIHLKTSDGFKHDLPEKFWWPYGGVLLIIIGYQ